MNLENLRKGRLSRRELLGLFGAVGTGALAAGCGVIGKDAGLTPTAVPVAYPLPTEGPRAAATVVPPYSTPDLRTPVPDQRGRVLVAEGNFRTTLDRQLGLNMMFAEPGGEPGPDLVFSNAGPNYQILPVGGFVMFAAGGYNLRIGRFDAGRFVETRRGISLPKDPEVINLVFIRGLFIDGNLTIEARDYVPGAIITKMYTSKVMGQNIAFISENEFFREIERSHRSPNCGPGCKITRILAYDVNTDAMSAVRHTGDDPRSGYQLESRNW